jgi:predicted enzyme related to lactoylglutathione lyase
MPTRMRNITIDCSDAHALAGFWSQVLGWNAYFDDDPEVLVAASFPADPTGPPSLLFIPVPEGKTAKNRMHVDISTDDRSRDEEVARLIGLGAVLRADHRTEDGAGWVVMNDPEGNEFCIERGPVERGSATPRRFKLVVQPE